MKVFTFLFVSAALLGTCSGLLCYTCSSALNSACGEGFTVSDPASISSNCSTACFKSKVTVDTFLGSVTTYSRGCATTSQSTFTCSSSSAGVAGVASGSTENCYCNTDHCNSAANMLPSIVLILTIVCAAVFLKKF